MILHSQHPALPNKQLPCQVRLQSEVKLQVVKAMKKMSTAPSHFRQLHRELSMMVLCLQATHEWLEANSCLQ